LTSSGASLGALADPGQFHAALDVTGFPDDVLEHMLRRMLLIRVAEEGVADLVLSKEAVCPCHLGIGQEAVAVGVSHALRKTDRVYGGHRSHAHYLAVGGDLFKMFAEILGRKDGASQGMGGSMHLFAPEVGFDGSVPIVGATIPIATGAGLAAKMDKKGDVAVAYFGDGACEEGVLHESLNFAANFKLPVLFVCENNLYSSHLDISERQPANGMARFADAHCISHRTVDGNDVAAVAYAADDLIAAARRGEGPGFLEAVTFRWRGHVGASEDIDVGVQRRPEVLKAWQARDPVRRLNEAMVARGLSGSNTLVSLTEAARDQVADAVARARKSAYPAPSALLDLVYAARSAT